MGIPFFNTGLLGSKKYFDQNEAKVLNFLRAYLEAIKVFKTEKEYAVKSTAQFTRINNTKAIEEGYEYFKEQLHNVPYPSADAMHAVVAQLGETHPKARKIDGKAYVNDRYLRQLENEGFVRKLWESK
jgi:hypothetical protein